MGPLEIGGFGILALFALMLFQVPIRSGQLRFNDGR
jgi:hypothetical protein